MGVLWPDVRSLLHFSCLLQTLEVLHVLQVTPQIDPT